ncbi:MAG: hypothetical protein V9G04_19200 [Nocardioides sp.]
MEQLMQMAAAIIALIGGLTLFRALFTPKRFRAKRPFLFLAGGGCLALSVFLYGAAEEHAPDPKVDTGAAATAQVLNAGD